MAALLDVPSAPLPDAEYERLSAQLEQARRKGGTSVSAAVLAFAAYAAFAGGLVVKRRSSWPLGGGGSSGARPHVGGRAAPALGTGRRRAARAPRGGRARPGLLARGCRGGRPHRAGNAGPPRDPRPALGHERVRRRSTRDGAAVPDVGRPGAATSPDPAARTATRTVATVRPVAVAAAPPRRGWSAWLAVGYATGVLVLLARLAAQHRAVARLARRATPVRDGAWGTLAADVARALGVRAPVALLRGDAPVMPMTWGVRRPAVLLPSAADAWPAARRRAVLLTSTPTSRVGTA
jgi:hypothetical protein